MNEQTPSYIYSPLEGIDAIRLLIIEPGQPDSDIHCRLIHTTLSECHDDIFKHYTALSYVWGDPSQKRVIFVDTRPFEVTSNLYDALHDIRDKEHSLRLWADAACVDQSNLDERGLQVGLMRQIYSFAAFTIIYLGKSNDDCDNAFEAMIVGKYSQEQRQVLYTQILTRPWFSRVWVYQELVLSRVPLVRCGRSQARWDAFSTILAKGPDERVRPLPTEPSFNFSQYHPKEHQLSPYKSGVLKAFQSLSDMITVRNKRQQGTSLSLMAVLSTRRGFAASDLRDLVYGHLAIASETKSPAKSYHVSVNYRKSVTDVFTDAARYIFHSSDYEGFGDRCMLLCNAGSNPTSFNDLPSWVPDWSLTSLPMLPTLSQIWLDDADAETTRSMCSACLPPLSMIPPAIMLGLMPFGMCDTVGSILTASNMNSDCLVQQIFEDFDHFVAAQHIYDLDPDIPFHGDLSFLQTTRTAAAKAILKPGFRRSTSYCIKELELLKRLTGRKIASIHGSPSWLCVVPANTLPGDFIYGLPEEDAFPGDCNSYAWTFFVLRPLSLYTRENLSEQDRMHFLKRQIHNERYCTLVGQAMIPAGLFRKKYTRIRMEHQRIPKVENGPDYGDAELQRGPFVGEPVVIF
ncbi:hypothetical protein VTL71DRAFT_5503 [Oculimacula yallundae]|uniref:Heterokaryon incompatibility domain-containing protein n=1 Tax=Oculimacula yallundae TaxID=86028 RepID=A0ABR4C3S5_9HELO